MNNLGDESSVMRVGHPPAGPIDVRASMYLSNSLPSATGSLPKG